MENFSLISEIKRVTLGILLIVGVVLTIHFLGLVWWQIVLFLVGLQLAMMLYKKSFSLKGLIFSAVYITTIIFSLSFLYNSFGYWGYLIGTIGLALLILFKRRKEYMRVKHILESQIWKKPLYKYVEAGEEIPKIRITSLRKKDTSQPQS